MNPCFFLLNPATNHLEFHSRSLDSTTTPHQFNIIPYIPDRFETTNNSSWNILKFNSKFLYQGLTNPKLKAKMFDFDHKHVKKYRNDLIGFSIIIPGLFFWVYKSSRKQAFKFPEKNPFTCSKFFMPTIIISTFMISSVLTYYKLKQRSLFLTGI